jgi:hypothetical protein
MGMPQAPGASSDPSPEGGHEIPVAMPPPTQIPGLSPFVRIDPGKLAIRGIVI